MLQHSLIIKIMLVSSRHVDRTMFEVSVVHKRSRHSSYLSQAAMREQLNIHEMFRFQAGGGIKGTRVHVVEIQNSTQKVSQ